MAHVNDGGLHMDSAFDGEEDGFEVERTLYVANVVREVTREQLKEFFSAIGAVTKVAIARRQSDVTTDLNYAFVEFKDFSTLETAKRLSGTTLRGKPILIQPCNAPGVPSLPGQSAYQQFAALAGMAPAMVPTGAALPPYPMVLPSAASTPIGATLTQAPPTQPGATPFYGTNMQTPDEVARTIYVGNINDTVTAEQLIGVFSVCGAVNFCRMAGTSTHPSRYAFIEFQHFDASQKAMQLNGMMLVDRPLRVNKSKNPIVRPQAEKRPDPRDRHMRDKKLTLVIESINRRVLGDTSSESRERRRSRSPSSHHRSSSSSHHKRSRYEEDSELPPAKRDRYE